MKYIITSTKKSFNYRIACDNLLQLAYQLKMIEDVYGFEKMNNNFVVIVEAK